MYPSRSRASTAADARRMPPMRVGGRKRASEIDDLGDDVSRFRRSYQQNGQLDAGLGGATESNISLYNKLLSNTNLRMIDMSTVQCAVFTTV
jgi:hypothetical protein